MVRPKCQNFLNEYKMSLYCIYKLYYQHNNLSENLQLKIELLSIWYLHSKLTCLQKFLLQNLMIHVIQHLKMFHWASYVLRRKKQHLAFGTNLFTLISDLEIMQQKKIIAVSEFSDLLYTLPFANIWIGSIFKWGDKCERSCSVWDCCDRWGVFWVLRAEWCECSKNMWPLGCAVHFHSPTKILITNWV